LSSVSRSPYNWSDLLPVPVFSGCASVSSRPWVTHFDNIRLTQCILNLFFCSSLAFQQLFSAETLRGVSSTGAFSRAHGRAAGQTSEVCVLGDASVLTTLSLEVVPEALGVRPGFVMALDDLGAASFSSLAELCSAEGYAPAAQARHISLSALRAQAAAAAAGLSREGKFLLIYI
jgi:hypothetical protein